MKDSWNEGGFSPLAPLSSAYAGDLFFFLFYSQYTIPFLIVDFFAVPSSEQIRWLPRLVELWSITA